ncbi:TPA: hypothetical protein [Aquificae Conch Spring virus]|nr:TPA: hypothetical protein [Aquificae Conch Spring virus]
MYTRIGCRDWKRARLKALKQGYLLGYQHYGCGCFVALKTSKAEMLRVKGIVYLGWDEWRKYLEDPVKSWSNEELFWRYNIWKYAFLKQKYLFIKDWLNDRVGHLPSIFKKRLFGSLVSRLTYRNVRVYFTPFGVYVDRRVEPLLLQLLQTSKILKEVEHESKRFEATV